MPEIIGLIPLFETDQWPRCARNGPPARRQLLELIGKAVGLVGRTDQRSHHADHLEDLADREPRKASRIAKLLSMGSMFY